jgi:hypothetical protein
LYMLTILVCERWQLCWQGVWGSKWTKRCREKVGMYLPLVKGDNFTQWIRKALLFSLWQSSRRPESTLTEENWKYELTLEFIRWNGWSWLRTQNLHGAMFGPLPKMMFFSTKRLSYLILEPKRFKNFNSRG